MTTNTKIEWADHTFNPWWGCAKISPACDHCYAAALDKRTGGDHWGANQPRKRTSEKNWMSPLKWNRQKFFECQGCGRRDTMVKLEMTGDRGDCDCYKHAIPTRQRVFCASMADVFDNEVDPQWRSDLMALIDATPNIDWLILTKRIGNANKMLFEASGQDQIPANIWLGATICNQDEADRDIPKLLAVPAAKRFLSIEPMLGPVRLEDVITSPYDRHRGWPGTYNSLLGSWWPAVGDVDKEYRDKEEGLAKLDWIICGGESGPGARPMHPDWARSLRDQCQAAKVPFLFKQWGEWASAYQTMGDGKMVFRQFTSHQQWVNKASTWVQGGIYLDNFGEQLHNGGDMARARDEGKFPVTIMHKVGKKTAGRLLDGVTHNGVSDGRE